MPFYLYRCNSCNKEWNELHKISDYKLPESLPCPTCFEVTVEKVFEPCAMQISYSHENATAMKKLNRSAFAERLQHIHDNSPGSNMTSNSNIVEIK